VQVNYTDIYAVTDKLGDAITGQFWLAVALMLLGGVLSSLSPSSVPRMVAIVNYTGREAKTVARATLLSLSFIVGICVVYSGVGALAGSLGQLLSVTGFLYYFTAALCLLMGLSMIRLIELPWKMPDLPVISHGLAGAFLLGFGFAFLIAPDAVPFMIAALAVTTFKGKILLGATLMLAFGIGHGVPVLFAGMLAPWYTNNFAVKKWQLAAEMGAGYVLVFLAMYFAVIA
jgi:cytochrome c biogenesis protein CcdA